MLVRQVRRELTGQFGPLQTEASERTDQDIGKRGKEPAQLIGPQRDGAGATGKRIHIRKSNYPRAA